MSPHVHIDPPRATSLLTVWLDVGNGRYRAYQTTVEDAAAWLARWDANWLEVAADLWDYEPPKPRRYVGESVLDVLGLRPQAKLIRRRV